MFRRIFDNVERPALIVGMLAIILIISYQTVCRYYIAYIENPETTWAFKNFLSALPLPRDITWTEEAARYIFIWISYLAIPVAIKKRSNIRVEIFYDTLSERWKKICWIIQDLCFLSFSLVVCILGYQYVYNYIEFPQVTSALRLSYAVPYAVLPVAFGLMSLRLIEDALLEVRRTGLKDTLLACGLTFLLALPVLVFSDLNALLLLFGYFIILLVIGVPVAVSLGISATATILGAGTLPLDFVASNAFTSIDSFPIMAIPFFIAAGVFMGAGGLSNRLLRLADEVLGPMPGGLGLATVGTCMFFAAISGSGPATVAAIGSLTIPAMIERGYDKMFAAALVAAAGAIGVMIPPSNPFVVYGVSSQVSIGKLFLGGIVPGVLTGLVLMVFCYFYSKKRGWRGVERKRSLSRFVSAFWDAKWALLVPVIILGGIYGGFMTPTEAGAIAALYGLIVGVFVYREISIHKLFDCLVEACGTSAIVIMLMSMATIFGSIMTLEDVPGTIAKAVLGFTENKIVVLMLLNVLLLIVGTFMEGIAAIVILTPILLPVVVKVGVDPLHFGIVMVTNLAIGFITPPVGVNIFVASGIAGAKITAISRAALPLLGLMILVLLLITYVPAIPLFLTD